MTPRTIVDALAELSATDEDQLARPDGTAPTAPDRSQLALVDDPALFVEVGLPLPLVIVCGGVPRLLAQAQLTAPLLQLFTGWGQHSPDALLGEWVLDLVELSMLTLAPAGPATLPPRLPLAAEAQAKTLLARWQTLAAHQQLPAELPKLLLLCVVPCLGEDLRRLHWPITSQQSQELYGRLVLLGGALEVPLPANYQEARAHAQVFAPIRPQGGLLESALSHLQQSLVRQLAQILPGTALDLLPSALCPFLLDSHHSAAPLVQVLRQTARTVHVSVDGLDETGLLRRMTRLLSWAMLQGLRYYQPAKSRPALMLPPALIAWEQS